MRLFVIVLSIWLCSWSLQAAAQDSDFKAEITQAEKLDYLTIPETKTLWKIHKGKIKKVRQ